ncbi:hypothetical protein I5M27_03720 [Adhaeribacter sp. BT258]|uniref:Lipoprotein n=1 Tax=Adhaeribacter terrigena TaxID=2793070 RepID=A0ABS1BY83_9BACT|nr:hypothetical protein [Adhaeribacter terrigena]MBK0402077.1 hypothetical protein [Adhaeribacter terrigena]
MSTLKLIALYLFFLSFSGCNQVQNNQKKPEIHQIRFGSFNGNPSENSTNRGWRFSHFMQINLNTDSVLLKQNQSGFNEYQYGKQPAKYFTGKIPLSLKRDIAYFEPYLFTKKSGTRLNNPEENAVLYSGPIIFLEYKKDTTTRYFYIDHIKSGSLYDFKLGKISEKLFDFAVNPDSLKLAGKDYKLNDDSLVTPIVNRRDFKVSAPPPPVQKTIKFTPPTENTNQ